MATWFSSKFPGVRYREHPTRKNGVKKDRYFVIRYQLRGARREEALGWSTEGWSEQRAAEELASLKRAARTGEGEVRLSEKREAQEEAKRTALEKEEAENRKGITFSEFFEGLYSKNDLPGKSKKSQVAENSLYTKWIKQVIGPLPLVKIGVLDIHRLKQKMKKKDKSLRTINYALAVIRQVFNYAQKTEHFSGKNPIQSIKLTTPNNGRHRFLTREEAGQLLEVLKLKKTTQLHDMCLLSLHCGLRAGEIFKLTWDCVDMNRETILLKDTKSGKNRYAYMTPTVKALLKARYPGSTKALVFTDKMGKQVQKISNNFMRTVDELSFNDEVVDRRDRVVFHTLRHTFASWLVENGTDLYTVKSLLGHSSLLMTERYSHLGENTLREAVRKISTF